MLQKIFLSLALVTTLHAQCTDNCLRCVENVCYYCDLSQGFRLIEGQCKPFQLENCYLFDDLGACLSCNKDFQLDSATQTCIKIMQENIVPNCQVYDSATTCFYCLAGFYLNNGKCEQISKPIANCEIENSQSVCLKCQNQYILSIDQKSCIENPKIENCQSYQNIKCDSCSTGYMEYQNFYLSQLFSLITNQQKSDFLMRQHDVTQGVIDFDGPNNCLKTQIQNCAKFYTFDFCDVCTDGYLRTDKGICLKQPVDRIPFCAKYDSLTSCTECNENYWLSDNQTCLPVKVVPFCKAYSKKLKERKCIECLKTHFLIGYDNCVHRTLEIQNCLLMNPLEESCIQCNNTFILTDDKLKCLAQISNCHKYQVSSYLTEKIQCLQCQSGFYVKKKENFCNQGDVTNCLVYEIESNVCQICQNKFYLKDGFCEPHDVIPNCQVYHPRLKNVCSDCNFESFLFEKRTHCQKANEITNCAIYLDEKTCAQCHDKYFLNSEDQCELIPASENCVQRIGSQCHKCLNDFVLENGICRDPLDYIQNECGSHNVDGTIDYERQKCSYCDENRIPVNYRDNHLCIEHDIMLYRQQKSSLDANCLIFSKDMNESYTCIRCKYPKVLSEGTCIDTCPTNKTLYKQVLQNFNRDGDRQNESFSVENINVCGEKLTNCKVAAPNLNQPDQSKVSYSCVQCQDGSIPSIEFNKNSVLVQNPFDENVQFGLSPVSFRPSVICVTLAQLNILGEINTSTNQIDNCDYYTNLGLTTGCTKCLHGHSGVVLDVVNQCEVYVNNKFTCSKCKHGYYKASIYECRPVITVDQCLYYSQTSNTTKCIECNTGYYVSSDTKCSQRQSSIQVNCTPNKLSDTCSCIDGHFNVTTNGINSCEAKPLNCVTPLNQSSCDVCDNTKSFKNPQTVNGQVVNICQAGGITDCIKYKVDQQICLECNETAFLKDGICVKHTSLSKCNKRSGVNRNTCDTCQTGSILFEYKTKCLQITKIQYCLEYDSIQTCKRCEDRYRLDNLRARCIAIPVEAHCITQVPLNIHDVTAQSTGFIDIFDAKDLTDFVYTCDRCEPGYFRVDSTVTFNTTKQVTIDNQTQDHPKKNQTFTVKVCQNYQNTLINSTECLDHSVTGLTDFSSKAYCKQCVQDYFPEFIQDNRYICLDKNYLQSKATDDLSNCRKVAFSGTAYTCALCNDGYFYDNTNKVCTQTCPTIYVIQSFTVNAAPTPDIIAFNNNHRRCDTIATVNNCNIYSTTINNSTEVCVNCKSEHVPIYATGGTTAENTNYNTFANKLETENPFAQYRKITECSRPSTFTNVAGQVGADGTISNCLKYQAKTTNVLYCIQCKLGFSGKIVETVFGGDTVQYIDSCVPITDCDTASSLNDPNYLLGRYYNNFNISGITNGFYIQDIVSCFKCTGTKTPVLFALNDYTVTPEKPYEPYGLIGGTNLNAVPVNDRTGHTMQCLQLYNLDGSVPTTASTGFLTGLVSTVTATSLFGNQKGCAIGWAKTDSGYTITNMKCISCKPGYTPSNQVTGLQTAWPTVDSCVQIENCNETPGEGPWMNACQNCIHYYDYWTVLSDDTKGHLVNFGQCVKARENISTTNCYAAYHTGPCQICQKGYVKDNDGVCVTLTVSKCTNYNLFNNATHSVAQGIVSNTAGGNSVINSFSLQIYLIYQEFQKGCTQCESDFITTQISSTTIDNSYHPYFCSKNPLNKLKPVAGVSDTLNCTNYGLIDLQLVNGVPTLVNQSPSLMVCKKCSSNFVLTKNGKCTPKCPKDYWNGTVCTAGVTSQLLNCKIANEENGTTCMECEDSYLNVAGVCVTYNVNTPIKNCQTYDMQGSFVLPYALCQVCIDGFYLSDDKKHCLTIPLNECASWGTDASRGKVWCLKCKQNFVLIEKKNQEQYCYPVAFDNSISDNQNQCDEWDTDLFKSRQLKCKKCKLGTTDYFQINEVAEIEIKTNCLTFAPNNVDCSSFDVVHNSGQAHPDSVNFPLALFGNFYTNTFKCLSCVQDQLEDSFKTYWYDQAYALCRLRTQVTNCRKHFQNKNECQVCQDNYLLKENVCVPLRVLDADEPINKGYIQKCLKMDECDGKVQLQGLHPHLQSLVSCHQCNESGKIPFVGVKIQNDNFVSLQEFGYPAPTGKFFHQQEKQKAVECLTASSTTFGVSSNTWTFPLNCGVGVVNTNQQALTVDPNTGIFCGACKAGFKATFQDQSTMKYKITTCALISNCESSTWFNYCSQCLPQHSYRYVQNEGVKYDVCVPYTSNPQCYAAEQIIEGANTTIKCKFCRKGYMLNPDGYCENILAPRCSQFKFNFRISYENYDLPTGLIVQGGGFGCQQCDTGFIGLYNPRDEVACTASPYHTDAMLTQTSNYLFGCKYYKVTPKGELECQTCQNDFVLTIRGKCVLLTGVPNCQLALDSAKCRKCKVGYVEVDRECIAGSIQNCLTYANNDQSYFQMCLQCQNGFYLQDNQCAAGVITNCEEFDQQKICRKCKKNFSLVYTKNLTNYCYPISQTIDCDNVEQDSFREGEIRCNKCKSNQYFLNWNRDSYEQTNTCKRFLPEDNCIRYDQERFFYASTFFCIECDALYYLDQNSRCALRTVILNDCIKYDTKGDKCENCKNGFFISTDGLQCVAHPEGIPKCITYLTETICIQCAQGYFLQRNTCVALEVSQAVANCEQYLDNGVCKKCKSGFMWVQNSCYQVQALNCATFENIHSCATCQPGFGFQYSADNHFLNCVLKNKTNCLESEDWAPFKCISCENDFYVDTTAEANCVAIVNKIQHCEKYKSETECLNCAKGTALTSDGKACLLNVQITTVMDPNCRYSRLPERPTCQACNWGNVFTYGYCKSCKQNTFEQGCMNCDPQDQNKCLLCRSGYYMTEKQVCVQNGKKPTDTPTKDNSSNGGTGETVKPKSEMIHRVMMLAILLFSSF